MPKISIVVPVYNAEKYISRCIDSILAQSFSDYELILIDDGSNDNSLNICNAYAKKDNRIIIIHKPNGGVSSARNTGISVASSPYVMFCDADDTVSPIWCKTHLIAIDANPNAWIVSNISRIASTENTKINTNSYIQESYTYCDIFSMSISAYCFNKIYSKEVLDNRNIRFDETRKIGEDVLFNIDYFSYCTNIVYINQSLYNYYCTPNSAMNSYQPNVFSINLELFEKRLPLIKDNELSHFCDQYFYMFLSWLDNTMSKLNKSTFFAKMRYNNKMMKSEEFSFCVANASGNNDSKLFMKVVRMHNYYIYWFFQKLCKLKDKILRKNKSE